LKCRRVNDPANFDATSGRVNIEIARLAERLAAREIDQRVFRAYAAGPAGVDGAMTVDIVEKYGPRSYAVGAGAIAIVPQGAWHRVHSANGRTVMSATLPGEHIDLDVDDPR